MKTESIAKWLSPPVQLIELQLIVLHNIEYSADTYTYIHTVCAHVCVCVCVRLSYKSLFILGKLPLAMKLRLLWPSYISFNL